MSGNFFIRGVFKIWEYGRLFQKIEIYVNNFQLRSKNQFFSDRNGFKFLFNLPRIKYIFNLNQNSFI